MEDKYFENHLGIKIQLGHGGYVHEGSVTMIPQETCFICLLLFKFFTGEYDTYLFANFFENFFSKNLSKLYSNPQINRKSTL